MISVLVPTSRWEFWNRGLLVDSLNRQTNQNFELVIVCDKITNSNPIDKLLINLFQKLQPQYAVKIIVSNIKHQRIYQASVISDNVGFRYCSECIVIHCDDDCWMHENIVNHVIANEYNKPPRAIFGKTIYYGNGNDNKLEVITSQDIKDERLAMMKKEKSLERRINDIAFYAHGQLWVCDLGTIRFIGGHELNYHLGCDSRLGWRLSTVIPVFFSIRQEYTCHHIGLTRYQKWGKEKNYFMIKKEIQTPALGHQDLKTIVNGGNTFWTSSWFKNTEVVYDWKGMS